MLKRLVSDSLPVSTIVKSLQGAITHIQSLEDLIEELQRLVHQMQNHLQLIVDPAAESGLVIHLVFLVESILRGEARRGFKNLAEFQRQYRLESDLVRTGLMGIEKKYQIRISEDEIAYLTQMFLENKLDLQQPELHTEI